MNKIIRFLAEFIKDMFSKDPWRKFDPELKLKFNITNRIGTWKVSKLTVTLQIYNVFEQDFFKNDFFLKLPEDNKLDAFIIYVNSFSNYLSQNKFFDDAETISRISIEIKKEGNAAHYTLALILFKKGKYHDALVEAEATLKDMNDLESQHQILPDVIRKEVDNELPRSKLRGIRSQIPAAVAACAAVCILSPCAVL